MLCALCTPGLEADVPGFLGRVTPLGGRLGEYALCLRQVAWALKLESIATEVLVRPLASTSPVLQH
jgi:hypothetical protein